MGKKILHIIEWIFAIFGLIIAIAMIASGGKGLISGFLFLISALVISPVFEKIPLLTSKPKKRIVLQFVFSFIIFVIAFFLVPPKTHTENDSVSDVSVTSTTTVTNITDGMITTKEKTLPVTTSSVSEIIQTTTKSATTSATSTTSLITSMTESTTNTTTSIKKTTNSTTNITTSATNMSTSTTRNTTSTTITQTNNYIKNEELKGRGMADVGRSEPDYVNTIGYVVISSDKEYELNNTDKFADTSIWTAPALELDEQQLSRTKVILPHKTEVVVLEQDLKHERYGAYSGYLLVQKLDDNKKYYIDVSNFVTKPYWTYNDKLKEAALTGMFIAEYHQVSEYYPVTNNGDIVPLEDGTIVLVTGTSGLSRYVHPDQTEIQADVWKDWKLGYGDVSVNFNAEDLTIVY